MANLEAARTVELQDSILIAQVLGGNREAFEPLVRRYLPMVQGFMLNQVGPGDAWEDLVQEAFVVAYRDLARLRRRERFGPWLVRIAKSRVADHHRSRRTRGEERFEERHSLFAPQTIGGELTRSAVLKAIGQLPERYRTIVYTYLIAEDEPGEIAARVGMNESTVRTRLQRGLERLRKSLQRQGITKDELRK